MLQKDNWYLLPDGISDQAAWNLMWTWSKPHVIVRARICFADCCIDNKMFMWLVGLQREHLLVWQKVNHFKHAKELVRKDLLKKNLARYQVTTSFVSSRFLSWLVMALGDDCRC